MEYLALSTFLLLADCSETHAIVESPTGLESNFFLGKDPSHRKVNQYFLSAIILNAGVGYSLKPKNRKLFWKGVSTMQASFVLNNEVTGFKVKIEWK